MKCRYDPSTRTVMCDLPESPTASAEPASTSTLLNDTVSLAGFVATVPSPFFQSATAIAEAVHLSDVLFESRSDEVLSVWVESRAITTASHMVDTLHRAICCDIDVRRRRRPSCARCPDG